MNLDELRRHSDDLGFVPQPSVRWLSPGELLRTGVKVGLSGLLADYDDRREVQAALDSIPLRAPLRDPERATEAWVDFAADIGDGFDSTYTVAWMLSRESLGVAGTEEHTLPRGSLLVLGGDEVYPTPSASGYENRMKGPYRAALPRADDAPLMVALPGNHDWYDGLTTFLRVFGQGRPIGGWRTGQTRSYFAVQLPARWWLLGVDTQLGTYIDGPQLAYFEEHVTSKLERGDGVIVCSATPTWVETAWTDVDAFNALHWFDRQYIRTRRVEGTDEREETGASVRLWITGDKHHYARYAERLPDEAGPRRQQFVTCGLGGAYLASTHDLPDALVLPPPDAHMYHKDPPTTFDRAPTTCPDASTSRAARKRLALPWSPYWLPRRNPGFARLAAGLQVGLYLVATFVFGLTQARPPTDAVRSAGIVTALRFDAEAFTAVAIAALLPWLIGLVRRRTWSTPSTTVIAVLLQAAVSLLLMTAYVAVPWPTGWPDWLVFASCITATAVLGGVLGSEAFALYVVSARSGLVAGWQPAGQAVEDTKGFVRMHIADNGDLTLYPVVVDEACHDWSLTADPTSDRSCPTPTTVPRPRLIEDPVVIARSTQI
ncbi:MAG: hypothetical protein GEV10_28785 [Streptosporangiales bacterium]|nr:hypothetical protein [Streptosporangiales bacterium]